MSIDLVCDDCGNVVVNLMTDDHQHNTETEREWHKGAGRYPMSRGAYVELVVPAREGGVLSVQMPEWLYDQIIADHNARLSQERQLATAVKALERIHAAEGLDQFSPQTIAWQALEELKGHREVKQ